MPRSNKIVLIGPGAPFRNGQSLFMSHLSNKLSDEFSIEFINFTTLYPSFLFPGSSQFDNSKSQTVTAPNTRMLSSINPLTWFKTAKHINKINPDIIAIDWWHPFLGPCYAGLIKNLSKANRQKVVFITENVISHEANKVDNLLTKVALKHARAFLALSQSVEDHLQSLFNKTVFRSALPIYDFYNQNHSIDQHYKQNIGLRSNDPVFLFFGLVRKYKGLDLLLEAFKLVIDQQPKCQLVIAGEFYEDAQPYLDLIKQLGIKDNIVLKNQYIPNEEVDQYFKACDCVVMPYRSATQSGILSVAYGFNKPVIATNVGELAAMIVPQQTGLVVPPLDPSALAEAMLQFLELQQAGVPFEQHIQAYLKEHNAFEKINNVFHDMINYLATT